MAQDINLQEMIDNFRNNIKTYKKYISLIENGYQITMLGKTAEQSTAEWKAQLEQILKLEEDIVHGLSAL